MAAKRPSKKAERGLLEPRDNSVAIVVAATAKRKKMANRFCLFLFLYIFNNQQEVKQLPWQRKDFVLDQSGKDKNTIAESYRF